MFNQPTRPNPVPLERETVALPDLDAVYVEVPKVACSSIKIALASLLAIDLDAVGGNPHEAEFPTAPPPAEGAHLFSGLFAFSFVRNPWDRLVSCFRDKIQGRARDFTGIHPSRGVAYCLAGFDAFTPTMSFDRFVDVVAEIPDDEADDHFRSQYLFLSNGAGEIAIDFVGHFETLDTDFRSVFDRLGVAAPSLPHRQSTTPPVKYAAFFDERTKDLVGRRFARDIALFGYEFDRLSA